MRTAVGDLDVDLGRTTVVRADRVRFANAGWSKQRDMASADRIEAGVPGIENRAMDRERVHRPRRLLDRGKT